MARIGAVRTILDDVSEMTVKNWLKLCEEYQRNEDGSITLVEGEE